MSFDICATTRLYNNNNINGMAIKWGKSICNVIYRNPSAILICKSLSYLLSVERGCQRKPVFHGCCAAIETTGSVLISSTLIELSSPSNDATVASDKAQLRRSHLFLSLIFGLYNFLQVNFNSKKNKENLMQLIDSGIRDEKGLCCPPVSHALMNPAPCGSLCRMDKYPNGRYRSFSANCRPAHLE